MTPYQTRLAMVGGRAGRTTLAWQVAALSRQKKLPALDKLLIEKKLSRNQTGAGLIEALGSLKGK